MTDADRATLRLTVMGAEGCSLTPYRDTTGHLSIGFGRNLDIGISHAEAEWMLNTDLAKADADAMQFGCYSDLSGPRQAVLVEMVFQLGAAGVRKFHKMFIALDTQDYARAAREMRQSLWAQQTPGRAERLAVQMETGRYRKD